MIVIASKTHGDLNFKIQTFLSQKVFDNMAVICLDFKCLFGLPDFRSPSKFRPFATQPFFDYSKSRLVWISEVVCAFPQTNNEYKKLKLSLKIDFKTLFLISVVSLIALISEDSDASPNLDGYSYLFVTDEEQFVKFVPIGFNDNQLIIGTGTRDVLVLDFARTGSGVSDAENKLEKIRRQEQRKTEMLKLVEKLEPQRVYTGRITNFNEITINEETTLAGYRIIILRSTVFIQDRSHK